MWLYLTGFMVLKLLFIMAVILGIAKIIKYVYRKHNSAVRLLKERYAMGEIDQKEYEERLKVLSV